MCAECKQFGYTLIGGVLAKTVRRGEHMLETPRAWAIQKTLYDRHRAAIKSLHIYDRETSTHYRASAHWFDKWRLRDPIDRGHGEQYVLPLERWNEEKQFQPQMPLF